MREFACGVEKSFIGQFCAKFEGREPVNFKKHLIRKKFAGDRILYGGLLLDRARSCSSMPNKNAPDRI
jgi:hypothetical protein